MSKGLTLVNRSTFVLLAALAVAVSGELHGQSAPACSTDTTARSALKGWVTSLVTAVASDTDRIATRNAVGLAAVAANQVHIVTTASVCTSARNAFAPLLGVPANTISVIVIKAGTTRYVVQAPAQLRGEFIPTTTFSTAFAALKNYTY